MSGGPTPDPAVAALVAKRYALKSAEELRIARSLLSGSDAVPDTGEADASVLLVKGSPGPAEASGLPALSGPDGQAAALALEAMGFDPNSVYAMLSRPQSSIGPTQDPSVEDRASIHSRLRATVEAVDPYAVIALDRVAGVDLGAAFGGIVLELGTPVRILGRTLLAVDGLEASLSDPQLKQRVWAQLRTLKPAPAAW